MPSSSVGSRELKTRLGTYLQRVRQGRTYLITDRGEPVAELRPVDQAATSGEAKLARLRAEGRVTRHHHGPLRPFRPIRLPKGVSAAKQLIDDREDRF